MEFVRIEPEENGILKFIRLEDINNKDFKNKICKYRYIYIHVKSDGTVNLKKTDTPMKLNIYPYIAGLVHGELTVLETIDNTEPLYRLDKSYNDTVPTDNYISKKVTIKRIDDNLAIIEGYNKYYKNICDIASKNNHLSC